MHNLKFSSNCPQTSKFLISTLNLVHFEKKFSATHSIYKLSKLHFIAQIFSQTDLKLSTFQKHI